MFSLEYYELKNLVFQSSAYIYILHNFKSLSSIYLRVLLRKMHNNINTFRH